MITSLTQKQKVGLLEAVARFLRSQLEARAIVIIRNELPPDLFPDGLEGLPIGDLICECKKLLVEGDIALKLFDLLIASRPINLSNEFRREVIATALKIGGDPQDLLDMVIRRADQRRAEVFKNYVPGEESKSERRQGGRQRKR